MSNDATPALNALLAHRPWARRVARCLVSDAATADDLLQDTWTAAIRRPPDVERDPRPWMRRVLKNLALNRHRAEGRRARREALAHERTQAAASRGSRAPDEILGEAEQHKRVVDAVMALEEPFKTTVLLRFYEGLAPREIAERMGVAPGTVSSRLHRALERLRDHLDAQEGGDRKRWIAALTPLAAPSAPVTPPTAVSTGLLAMTLSKPKLLVLGGLAILMLGVGAYFALDLAGADSAGTDEPPMEVGAHDPALRGTGDGTVVEPMTDTNPTPDAPSTTDTPTPGAQPAIVKSFKVHGVVQTPDGTPIEGAEVFALPRNSPGIDTLYIRQKRFGRVRTDAKGRFALTGGPIRGPRLVAWYDGYLPATLDNPEQHDGTAVTLTLGAPRMLRVMVSNEDGVWPGGVYPQVSTDYEQVHERTADPRLQSFYAGHHEELDEDRREPLDIPIGTMAPVEVEVSAPWGYVASPRKALVPAGQREVRFELLRSAHVTLDVVPAEGEPVFTKQQRFEVIVFRGDSKEIVWSQSHPQPKFELHRELSPGTYRMEVRSKGYEAVSKTLEIKTAGERVAHTATLERIDATAKRSNVVIRTTRGDEVPEATRKLAFALAGKHGIRWIVLARTPRDPRWREVNSNDLPGDDISVTDWFGDLLAEDKGLAGGEYDFLVAEGGTGRVGIARSVRIFNDQDNVIDVRLEPGSFVRLSDALDPDLPRTSIIFRSDIAGVLPPYEFSHGGQAVWQWDRAMQQLTQIPLLDTVFGPFPGKITLEVEPTDAR